MKKLRFIALFLMIMTMIFALPVGAATTSLPKLVDDAGLLTGKEANKVDKQLEKANNNSDIDIVVVTVQSLDGQDVQDYADTYYDQNGYSEDGILLLMAMDERDYAFSTKGYGRTAFTDAGIDYIEGKVVPSLSKGKYADAFTTFAKLCDQFVDEAVSGRPYDNGHLPKKSHGLLYLLISVVLGGAFGSFSSGSKKAALTSVHKQSKAANYVTERKITAQKDIFLNRKVFKEPKAKPSKSSSSGSSVHTSSSGQAHGGKSGKF